MSVCECGHLKRDHQFWRVESLCDKCGCPFFSEVVKSDEKS